MLSRERFFAAGTCMYRLGKQFDQSVPEFINNQEESIVYSREDTQTAATILRKAVPLMVERDIPTNPCNYALWYSYAADKDMALKEELDRDFPIKGSYDPEKSEQLFFDYFVKSYLPNSEDAQESLVGLLTGLFGNVQKTAEGTREYGDSLREGMEKIQNAKEPEELVQTLDALLKDTEAADELTRDFHNQLNSAKEEIESLKQQLEATEKSAFIDTLTQIGNRRSFDQVLSAALASSEQPACLLLIDLDHFKQFNDTYGHLMGDRVLSAVGKLLNSLAQQHIHVARYGGEEFAVVMTQAGLAEAHELGERVRSKMAGICIKKGDVSIDSITASIGVAVHQPDETPASLINRADKALYQAKQNGRDQVQKAA